MVQSDFYFNYDELHELLTTISQIYEDTEASYTQLAQDTRDLLEEESWVGQGAAAFATFTEQQLFPSVTGLLAALHAIHRLSRQMCDCAEQAEADGAQLFNNLLTDMLRSAAAAAAGGAVGGMLGGSFNSSDSTPIIDGGIYDIEGNLIDPDDVDADTIFIPGVTTEFNGMVGEAGHLGMLDDRYGNNIVGIYNATDDFISDTMQAFGDRYDAEFGTNNYHNAAVDSLYAQLEREFTTGDGRVNLVGHSQGGAIVAEALTRFANDYPQHSLEGITVDTYGTFGTDYPIGPDYNHYMMADPVPIAAQFVNLPTLFNDPTEYGAYLSDITLLYGSGHGLEDYLNAPRLDDVIDQTIENTYNDIRVNIDGAIDTGQNFVEGFVNGAEQGLEDFLELF